MFFRTRQCTRVHPLGVQKRAKLEKRNVFGHIDKFWKGHDAQIKKNARKNVYLGFIFIPEKYVFRVCFESPFTRMISSLRYKCPPGIFYKTDNKTYMPYNTWDGGMNEACIFCCSAKCIGCALFKSLNWVLFFWKWYTGEWEIGEKIGMEKVRFSRSSRHIYVRFCQDYPGHWTVTKRAGLMFVEFLIKY